MAWVLDICVCYVMIKSGNNQDSDCFYVYMVFLKKCFYIYVCINLMLVNTYVDSRGKLAGVSSLLLPCGFWEPNPGDWSWQQTPPSAEPSLHSALNHLKTLRTSSAVLFCSLLHPFPSSQRPFYLYPPLSHCSVLFSLRWRVAND